MTNEEIVMDSMKNKIKNRRLSALSFRKGIFLTDAEFSDCIDKLKAIESPKERVFEIARLAYKSLGTVYYKNRHFQCKGGARRSASDIMRIYNYYFDEIDLFTVMNILYKLVSDRRLSTRKCPDVHRQVFWIEDYYNHNYSDGNYEYTEFNIYFSDWKNIGEN
jgi:hypothetical protein